MVRKLVGSVSHLLGSPEVGHPFSLHAVLPAFAITRILPETEFQWNAFKIQHLIEDTVLSYSNSLPKPGAKAGMIVVLSCVYRPW